MPKHQLLAFLTAALAAAATASASSALSEIAKSPSPSGGGTVDPASGGDGGGVCAYSADAELTFNTSDADRCCECFHNTCDLVAANCPLGTSGTNLVNYFAIHYCAFGEAQPVGYIFLAVITFVVFSLLGTTADNFFVVQLETLSQNLKLSPTTAAITLLAIGNSAPDVFSDLAAVGNSDFALALGELMGASMFLTTVVLAAVILYATQDGKECTVDKTPIRDILSFAVVLAALFVFVVTGDKVTTDEALCIIGAYIIYVICVIVYEKKYGAPSDGARETSNSSLIWSRRSTSSQSVLENGLETGLIKSHSSVQAPEQITKAGEEETSSVQAPEQITKAGEEEMEDNLIGLDWDSTASIYDKVVFIAEYPFSFLRWLSIPSADNSWSSRRRFMAHVVPIGATVIVYLDFSPMWTGGTPYDGFGGFFWLFMILSYFVGTAMFQLSKDDELPKWSWVLVALAFLSTVAWLDLLGNECVAVLESIGVITGLTDTAAGHSILGVTLLAWANSIGDFVADTAVTKAGKPEMGVSSVFASPMLTCCLGIGISTLITCFQSGKGYVDTVLDSELSLSFVFMTISLCSSLAVIVGSGFKLPRWYAFYLFALYAAYMLFSILTVLEVFALIPGREPSGDDQASKCPIY